MAEALLKKMLRERFGEVMGGLMVASCGMMARHGFVDYEVVQVMNRRTIDISGFRSKPISAGIMREYDIVLTMTENIKQDVLSIFPLAKGRVWTLTEFAGQGGEVEDPVGKPIEEFNMCADLIQKLLESSFDRLLKE